MSPSRARHPHAGGDQDRRGRRRHRRSREWAATHRMRLAQDDHAGDPGHGPARPCGHLGSHALDHHAAPRRPLQRRRPAAAAAAAPALTVHGRHGGHRHRVVGHQGEVGGTPRLPLDGRHAHRCLHVCGGRHVCQGRHARRLRPRARRIRQARIQGRQAQVRGDGARQRGRAYPRRARRDRPRRATRVSTSMPPTTSRNASNTPTR